MSQKSTQRQIRNANDEDDRSARSTAVCEREQGRLGEKELDSDVALQMNRAAFARLDRSVSAGG
jgi:hypothetical protein